MATLHSGIVLLQSKCPNYSFTCGSLPIFKGGLSIFSTGMKLVRPRLLAELVLTHQLVVMQP